MIFCAVNEVLTKAFFAEEKTKIPMISAIASMVFNVAVVALFGKKLGIGGIALVSGLAVMLNAAINGIIAKKTAVLSPAKKDGADIVKSLVSAVVMGGAVSVVYGFTAGMGGILSFGLAVGAGVVVYAILTLLLRSEEMGILKSMIFKKR
jgi:putative peptidoglycan lipid II flippase